jgi:hypothetical protein
VKKPAKKKVKKAKKAVKRVANKAKNAMKSKKRKTHPKPKKTGILVTVAESIGSTLGTIVAKTGEAQAAVSEGIARATASSGKS